MSKLKTSILFALFTTIIYTIFLYLNNGNKIVINIDSSRDIKPKIYYSLNEAFNEKDTISEFKREVNSYIFKIPKSANINKIRFDVTSKSNVNITLNSILLTKKKWFKSSVYKIDLSIIQSNQIKNLIQKSKSISFNTTGNDPWILLDYKPQKIYSINNFYPIYLILSIIISTIILYLINIYKSYDFNDNLIAKIILYSLFLAFISFKAYYYKDNVHFGYPPDEIAHYEYTKYVDKNLEFIPKFENMNHYLAHPPLYYDIISLALNDHKDINTNVNSARTLSMLIYIFSVILILYLGFSSKLTILGDFVYLSFISSIPMHSYIGGSISNDTLAILGAIVAIIGLKRLLEKDYSTTAYLILAIGIFISFFAKLTAAILLFFAIIYYIIYLLVNKKMPKFKKVDIVILMLFLTPIIYYQVHIMLTYHAITPTFNVTHPKEFLKSNFYIPPEHRVHLSAIEWLERMWHYIHSGWFGIHSHHSFGHEKWSGVFGLVILHIIAVISLLFNCKENNFCKLGKITLLALFSVLVVQYLFSYKAHIHNGYMGGLQPRYVLPFMFAFAIMASTFVEKFKNSFWFSILIIAISIQAIYSDFFYFLLYYN